MSAERLCAICGRLSRLYDHEGNRWLCKEHHQEHCEWCRSNPSLRTQLDWLDTYSDPIPGGGTGQETP